MLQFTPTKLWWYHYKVVRLFFFFRRDLFPTGWHCALSHWYNLVAILNAYSWSQRGWIQLLYWLLKYLSDTTGWNQEDQIAIMTALMVKTLPLLGWSLPISLESLPGWLQTLKLSLWSPTELRLNTRNTGLTVSLLSLLRRIRTRWTPCEQ